MAEHARGEGQLVGLLSEASCLAGYACRAATCMPRIAMYEAHKAQRLRRSYYVIPENRQCTKDRQATLWLPSATHTVRIKLLAFAYNIHVGLLH